MRESVVITIRDVIARSDLLITSRLIIWYLLNDVRFNVKVSKTFLKCWADEFDFFLRVQLLCFCGVKCEQIKKLC